MTTEEQQEQQFNNFLQDAQWSPWITCANCGFNYTHHFKTIVYNRRREDAEKGKMVIVGSKKITIDESMASNPSPRRDAVTILLSCEACDWITAIDIIQHKGNTSISKRLSCHKEMIV